jgi:hypothetical protein
MKTAEKRDEVHELYTSIAAQKWNDVTLHQLHISFLCSSSFVHLSARPTAAKVITLKWIK